MSFKLVCVFAVTFLFQVSFAIEDDAILAFQKQAETDLPGFKKGLEMKTALAKELLELKDKVDELIQTRQAGQKNLVLEASIQEQAEKLLQDAFTYVEYEKKSLEKTVEDFSFLKAVADQLKSSQKSG